MNPKNIWIINEYAGSPYHGMEFRHFYLSKELQKLGYNVTIISASYSHLFKKLPTTSSNFTFEDIEGVNYLWIKVPHYSSSHSKKRVLKWLVYTFRLFLLPIKKLTKPDAIIVSPMQTLPIYPAYIWAKKFKASLIFEVKDIWPLSIIELGGYSPKNPFIQLLKYFEKMAIQKSDAIVSVLPNYQQYLQDEGWSKNFYYIPNGVDLKELEKIEYLNTSIKNQIPQNKFIVGYAGTIGTANALENFIEAARLLKEHKDILFVLVGEGDKKIELQDLSNKYQLDNILFLPAIPKVQIQSLLSLFDVCYIELQNKELFKYGISPNKIFDYMYAAKPILLAVNSPNNPVSLAQCGICIYDITPENIAKAILEFYQMPENQRKEIGSKGKEYVLKHHTFQVLAKKYDELMKSISSK